MVVLVVGVFQSSAAVVVISKSIFGMYLWPSAWGYDVYYCFVGFFIELIVYNYLAV